MSHYETIRKKLDEKGLYDSLLSNEDYIKLGIVEEYQDNIIQYWHREYQTNTNDFLNNYYTLSFDNTVVREETYNTLYLALLNDELIFTYDRNISDVIIPYNHIYNPECKYPQNKNIRDFVRDYAEGFRDSFVSKVADKCENVSVFMESEMLYIAKDKNKFKNIDYNVTTFQ